MVQQKVYVQYKMLSESHLQYKFTSIKTYSEKLSSISLKWEVNLQYNIHEIGVRADMETAAYSEYAENLHFARFAQYPS